MTLKASNYPTVRPSLDLNFAQTKRLDPRITYSRASSGTYFDSTGTLQSAATNQARFDHDPTTGESLGLLVEEARTNYFTNSAGTNKIAPPDRFLDLGQGFGQFIVPSAQTNYNLWSRASIDQYGAIWNVTFYLWNKPENDVLAFNLFASVYYYTTTATTTVDGITLSCSGQGNTTVSITPLGNNLYKCNATARNGTAGGTPSVSLQAIGTFTGGERILVSHIQAERGTFSTSYIPTIPTFTSRSTTATYYDANGTIQTAGIDVARDDAYFPDENGVMRPAGLLLEAAGTNLVTYSEQFDNVAWTQNAGTKAITANTTVAPDGTTTADTVTVTQYTELGHAGAVNGPKTFSVFLKAGTITTVTLRLFSSVAPSEVQAVFNLTTGAATITNGSSVAIASTQKLPNGWYRCRLTRTDSSSNHGGTIRYTGTGDFYIWGAQLETGSFPTSYIPTTTATVTRAADVSSSSTVTRSADVAQITGSNFSSWYNQSEGTFLMVESASQVPQTNTHRLEIYRNGAANTDCIAHVAGTSSNFTRLVGRSASSNTTLDVSANTTWSTTRGARAIALKQDNCALARGSSSTTDTSSVFPQNLDALGFGSPANTFQSNAVGMNTLARLTYYPVRLPDATLQTLTS